MRIPRSHMSSVTHFLKSHVSQSWRRRPNIVSREVRLMEPTLGGKLVPFCWIEEGVNPNLECGAALKRGAENGDIVQHFSTSHHSGVEISPEQAVGALGLRALALYPDRMQENVV
jgi:hypothetical protein